VIRITLSKADADLLSLGGKSTLNPEGNGLPPERRENVPKLPIGWQPSAAAVPRKRTLR
jgi:hypothetical protein